MKWGKGKLSKRRSMGAEDGLVSQLETLCLAGGNPRNFGGGLWNFGYQF